MKKITLVIALLLFVKVQAQFFDVEFGLQLPETLIVDEWSGEDWGEALNQEATFNSNCQVETISIFISGFEFSRIVYTYNADNQPIEIVTQMNNLGTWVNSTRTQNTFTGGNLTDEVEAVWVDSEWVNSIRIQSTFTNGNATEEIESSWDGSSWINTYRTQNTFNAGNLTEEIESTWDGTNWLLASRTLYTYNGAGNILEILNQLRDPGNTSWEANNRSVYTYDTDGMLEEEVYEEWNTASSTWVGLELTTYAYTGSNASEITTYYWDGSAYVAEEKSLITYNDDDLITQLIFQEYDGSDWENTTRATFLYPACLSLSTEQFATFDISLFPNPANDSFKILNLPQGSANINYTVFDAAGRLVQKGTLNSDYTINTQYLTSGLYLVKFSDASQSVTKQLVVKH